jgi:NAD(P)-dependent dehydrogenase (short-subunit alcohol dehydrogenase family)
VVDDLEDVSAVAARPVAALPGAFRLDGRVALITGGTRNIGRAIAATFAAAGADLVLTARHAQPLAAVAEEIRQAGARVCAITGDVRIDADMRATVDQAYTEFGRVDVLVNNAFSAGRVRPQVTLDTSDQDWDDCWRANVLGPFRLMQLVGRRMLEASGGSIINILSISAFGHDAGLAAYAATKSALWALTRYVAAETAPKLRVNAIAPGTITEDGRPRTIQMERLIPVIPAGRIGHPTEIANAALFLASDASSYVTGHVMTVDGGIGRGTG